MTVPRLKLWVFSTQQTMVDNFHHSRCSFPSQSILYLLLLPQWNLPRKCVLFQIRYFANGILNGYATMKKVAQFIGAKPANKGQLLVIRLDIRTYSLISPAITVLVLLFSTWKIPDLETAWNQHGNNTGNIAVQKRMENQIFWAHSQSKSPKNLWLDLACCVMQ